MTLQKTSIYTLGTVFFLLAIQVNAQVSVHSGAATETTAIDFKIDFSEKDGLYAVMFHEKNPLFYYYIISGEPIGELSDKDLFIDIVDAPRHGWPVLDAGYIDTRYGVNEFTFDLKGKNLYILATNGENYSKVSEYKFK